MTTKGIYIVQDPVVVYDIMREAANRVCSIYAERVTTGTVEDPAVEQIRAIWAEADSVDTHDQQAQRLATDKFNERYETLLAG